MLAKALALNGAEKVYISGRRLPVLEEAAKSIGPNVHAIQCDVTSKDSLSAAVSRIESEVGHVNLVICNSGISGPSVAPIKAETTLEEWAEANWEHEIDSYVEPFRVNVASVWYTTMAFLKLLDKGNKKGNVAWTSQVVVTTSVAAYNKKAPGGWAYGQSKSAVTHAMKHLSVALPQWNIR